MNTRSNGPTPSTAASAACRLRGRRGRLRSQTTWRGRGWTARHGRVLRLVFERDEFRGPAPGQRAAAPDRAVAAERADLRDLARPGRAGRGGGSGEVGTDGVTV